MPRFAVGLGYISTVCLNSGGKLSKKIIIASYFGPNEPSPRAFRANELAKEFVRRGHRVVFICPESPSLESFTAGFELVQIPTGFLFNRNAKHPVSLGESTVKSSRTASIVNRLKSLAKLVYLEGKHFEFCIPLARALIKHRNADLYVSVGLPIGVHVGGLLAKIGGFRAKLKLADYGDPFSKNAALNVPKWQYLAEKVVLKGFDYVVVPHAVAIPAFEGLFDPQKILIISQALDFNQFRLAPYVAHDVKKFAYAGMFYEGVRDPSFLFEWLAVSSIDFEFHLWVNMEHPFTHQVVTKYQKILGSKIVVHEMVNRVDCIYNLSQFDFLINISNDSPSQIPSKIIDYNISRRPYLSLSYQNFSETEQILKSFFDGDYSKSEKTNLDAFDIEVACSKILGLS